MQKIEDDLWAEFETELNKKPVNVAVNIPESDSLDKFWNMFLTESFPEGKLNQVIEKNFAIYIKQNNLDIDNIKEIYIKNNWKPDGLIGWYKKVNNGELTTFNIKELLDWANNNLKNVVPLLEKAQEDLELEDLPVIPIDELDNLPDEEIEWICDRLIRPKSIGVVAGKRSTLKTWVCLNMGLTISSNIPFLDKFKVKPCNVLFLDGESNRQEIKKRKIMVKESLGIKNAYNMFVLSEYYLKLDSDKGIKQIEKKIKKLNIGLVIADSYRRFISFREDSADETSQFFDKLKQLCNRTGVSLLFIHHEKKGRKNDDDEMDLIRGSSDFVNMMDSIIQVSRKGNKLTLKQTKNKFGTEVPAFNIERTTDEKSFFGFKFLGLDEPISVVCAKVILKWASKKKSFTYTSGFSFAESKNFKEDTYKKCLIVLQENDYIVKGEGKRSPFKVLKTEWSAEL